MRFSTFEAVMLMLVFTPFTGMGQAARQTAPNEMPGPATLKSLRNRFRPLLIFAPDDQDPRLQRQVQLFEGHSSGLLERHVVLLALIGKKTVHGRNELDAVDQAELSFEDAGKARRRFQIAPQDFSVILIGKDGDEKFRTHTPVTMEKLNAVIDAMPMRQQEVRNGNSK